MIESLDRQIPFFASEGKTIRKILTTTDEANYMLVAYTDDTFAYCKATINFEDIVINDGYTTEYLIHEFEDELLLEVFTEELVRYLHEKYEKERQERLIAVETAEYNQYLKLKAKFEGKA